MVYNSIFRINSQCYTRNEEKSLQCFTEKEKLSFFFLSISRNYFGKLSRVVTKRGGRREGRVKSIAVRRAKPNWNYMRAVNIGGKIHEWNIECVIFGEFRTVYPYLSFGHGAAS